MSTGPSSGFVDYVLAEMRCAGLRARLMVNEVEATTLALGAGFIDIDNAIAHLTEIGALRLVEASS